MVFPLFFRMVLLYYEYKEWNNRKKASQMDEKDFELLRVLEDTKNMTRAADRLYMTQSALSKRVRSIERELNVELLLRSRQGIHFTPAGEQVLAHSKAAASELSQLRRNLDAMHGEVCGTLNAGISVNYALYRLPDVLAAYHRKNPKVNLHISTGQSRNLHRQILDGSLDVAVVRGEYPWEGMQFLLSQENICMICSQSNKNKPLGDYLYISHKTDASLDALMTRWKHENGLSSQPSGFCVDNVTACAEMVKRSLGWALLPEIALANFDGVIRPCTFENGEPFVRRTYILCQREALELPQVQAFVETLKMYR